MSTVNIEKGRIMPSRLQIGEDASWPAEEQSSSFERDDISQRLHREIEALIPRLTRYARALTHDLVAADDLVQEVLSRALEKLHLWQEGTDLRAWLFTIMHHQHVNEVRRAAREKKVPLVDRDQPLEPHQSQRLEFRDLARAIDTLSGEQKRAVMLVAVEEMRYDEAALLLNLPIGTVRSRVSRGRDTLRKLTGRVPREGFPNPADCEAMSRNRRSAHSGRVANRMVAAAGR
jgi:RNA polymerase sigma-70 factor, ECF subfamily